MTVLTFARAKSGRAFVVSDTVAYGYNIRSELISAAKLVGGDDPGAPQTATTEYAYQYDDIGNRITSLDLGTNRTYTANNLNQYTQISNLCDSASLREEFIPQFDDDGNQTLVQTATGIWQVQYNGENRPIHWARSSDDTSILMFFDRMGRRVQYLETCGNATNENKVFTYDGYLQVANFDFATQNAQRFAWDPTEPIATRPLVFYDSAAPPQFYTHDGNKNVSDVVSFLDASVVSHYEYGPFGGSMVFACNSDGILNPFRFSSEYSDSKIGLISYIYRHYSAFVGRWQTRDAIGELDICNLYCFVVNKPCLADDILGLWSSWGLTDHQDMTDNAVKGLDIQCLEDSSVRDKVIDYLKWANVGMDFSPKYNQSNAAQLPYHFNRAIFQDEASAKSLYAEFLSNQQALIAKALAEHSRQQCDSALKELGKLSHAIQDYYGHGVSPDYGKPIPGRNPTGNGDLPRYGVGRMSGSPTDPTMSPSSYSKGAGIIGSHGFILLPEPGTRAPDTEDRKKAATKETMKYFYKYLLLWCENCNRCPPERQPGNRTWPSKDDYDDNY